EELGGDELQRSRRNSNAGRAVAPGLSESSVNVGDGSSAMIGSYPGVTAGGDGDGDSDDVDMATLLRMQAAIEAKRKQADDAEEQVARISGTILALTPLMERLEEQVAASTVPASSAGGTGTAVQG
ncbi:unnamed protein product, partial [Scytosiphon promiscuus]